MSRSPSAPTFAERAAAAMAKVRRPEAAADKPDAAEAPRFDHLTGGDPARAFAAAAQEAMAKVRPPEPTAAAKRRQTKA